jgi:hypothetical protein
MRRLFAVVATLACAVAATPGFAQRGTIGQGTVRASDPYFRFAPIPQVPNMASRIPSPLARPAGPPVINGPVSQPALRGLNGIGQR